MPPGFRLNYPVETGLQSFKQSDIGKFRQCLLCCRMFPESIPFLRKGYCRSTLKHLSRGLCCSHILVYLYFRLSLLLYCSLLFVWIAVTSHTCSVRVGCDSRVYDDGFPHLRGLFQPSALCTQASRDWQQRNTSLGDILTDPHKQWGECHRVFFPGEGERLLNI